MYPNLSSIRRARLLRSDGQRRRIPDVRIDAMIIGAQKAGTTSLLRYLAEHPALGSHETVECGYFASDTEYEAGWPPACDRYFRGVDADMLVGKSAGVYVDER